MALQETNVWFHQRVTFTQLRDEKDLPFVELPDGMLLQLLAVDLDNGIWINRNRFPPGHTLPTHLHTGSVQGYTISGRWHYLESPDAVNTSGSFLFEPAGSMHTLHVPDGDEMTDVWFAITGANVDFDEHGNVVRVIDAPTILFIYRMLCQAQHGIDDPPVVFIGGAQS